MASAWQQVPELDRALPDPSHGISPPEWMPFLRQQTPPSPNITKRSQREVKERSKGALRELDLEKR
jgi:hypothetical protein